MLKVWIIWYESGFYNSSKCIEIAELTWEELKKKLVESGWKKGTGKYPWGENEYLEYEDSLNTFKILRANAFEKPEEVVYGWKGFKKWFSDWVWNVFE